MKLKKIWFLTKLVYYLIRVFSTPSNTKAVLGVSDASYHLGHVLPTLQKIKLDSKSAQIIAQKFLLDDIDLDKLRTLPDGSFGRAYAEYMFQNNLRPNFFNPIEIIDDQTYCMVRLRQTHDFWHVVTGFDTTVRGEIGLQSFYYVQTHDILAAYVLAFAILGAICKNKTWILPFMENIVRGWEMGKNAQPLFPFDWEANWETPLAEVQSQLLGEKFLQENLALKRVG